VPKEKSFHILYDLLGIHARIILVCVCDVPGIDVYCIRHISLDKCACLYRPVVSWQRKVLVVGVVVVVVVVAAVAVAAVCQTRRVLHPCPYQYHGSMGRHVG
jgi:hypothetical protein